MEPRLIATLLILVYLVRSTLVRKYPGMTHQNVVKVPLQNAEHLTNQSDILPLLDHHLLFSSLVHFASLMSIATASVSYMKLETCIGTI